jgi:seryl-tRNA synthetase
MEYKLKGHIRFSAFVKEAENDLLQELKKLNEKYSRIAERKEKATRIDCFPGELMEIKIFSSGYPRAHDALLEFKNVLAGAFGEKYRIGIREILAETYEITVETKLSEKEIKDIAGELAEVEILENQARILFKDLSESELKQRLVDRMIKKIKMEEEKEAKGVEYGYVLKVSSRKDIFFHSDVASKAQSLGWIKRFPGRAQWILLPPAAKVLISIKELIIEKVLNPLGFSEAMFPKLIHFDVMKNMPGYFEYLAEGMFYVVCPPRDPKPFDRFKKEAMLKKEVRKDLLTGILPPPEYVLAPAQCEPFYQIFSGEIVRLEDLPIKLYDASGWTWRAEGGGVEGLVRTTEFFRLESIWLGSPEQVLELRDKIAELSFELSDKILDLDTRMVVGAPFYALPGEPGKVDASSSINIPTLDLEVWLPYRGSRENSEWLEVGAFTNAKRKYIDSFHIKEAKNREIWTGCGGFGLTRWLAGYLAQKGFEPDNWSKELRKKVEEIPGAPKTVTWPG